MKMSYYVTNSFSYIVSCVIISRVALGHGNTMAMGRSCGIWQEEYSRLHESILKREIPSNLLVSVPVRAGLADNLAGMVTQFLLAFLTKRAFLRLSYQSIIPLEGILKPAYIYWDNHTIPANSISCLLPPYPRNVLKSFLVREKDISSYNGMTIYPLQMVNSNHMHKAFKYKNLSNLILGRDHTFDVIAIAGNRGRSIALFKNPFYAEYLTSIGLRPETIFSCIYRYLFRYKSDVICISDACKRAKNAIIDSKRNGSVIIGMHVRISDEIFRHDMNVTLVNASGHFSCAEQYMSEISQKNESVIFLVSNSLNLRIQAKKRYGDKVITDTVTRSSHTGHITYNIFYIS